MSRDLPRPKALEGCRAAATIRRKRWILRGACLSPQPTLRRHFPMAFVLALDQGTTSSRAIVFERDGSIRASAQQEFRQIFPQPGWVEHDPTEVWATQSGVMHEALAKAGLSGRDVAAIGITNQRETTLVWERA